MTFGARARLEGYVEGYTEGFRIGFVQGQRIALIDFLLNALPPKLGPFSETDVTRIREAPVDDLWRWHDRIWSVSTIEELFDEPASAARPAPPPAEHTHL